MKNKIFFGIAFAIVGGFVLFAGVPQAQAADCTAPATQNSPMISGVTSQYVNGFLRINFHLAPEYRSNGLALIVSPKFVVGGACEQAWEYHDEMRFAPHAGDFSIRFDSNTTFQIWNDTTNTQVDCVPCARVLGDAPGYYQVIFEVVGRTSVLQSDPTVYHFAPFHIRQSYPPEPVISGTLPTPAGCEPFHVTPPPVPTTRNSLADYERVEYVDGLLRYHFKLTPAGSAGVGGYSGIDGYDENCHFLVQSIAETLNLVEIPAFTQYYSLRFSSPTTFDFWNDHTNTKLACDGCQNQAIDLDVHNGVPWPYIRFRMNSFEGFVFAGAHLDSTPFPIVQPAPTEPHSSVVFLPGLEASRLYRNGAVSENQLWDPNRHQDIQDLFLKNDGTSKLSGIYTRDIVDTIDISTQNIYKSFIQTMDGLVADHTIKAWKALPYDWRFDFNPVINSSNMIAQIEQMAAASDTGKVTIIAHSNGGLVAKALITRLKAQGKAGLVDKLVLVAVPQMGTPKAIEALLHGEDVTWLKGLFVPRYLTRSLAEHMQSAFNLLPTEAYFAKVDDPVIEFDRNAKSTEDFRRKYGNNIASAAKMRDFLKGIDGRKTPKAEDVISPNVLLPSFINKSATRANEQDSWTPPRGLKVVQIAGWGLETLRGIQYTDRIVNNKKVLDERPKTTTDGDKTVISYSADKMSGEKYYVDLLEYNRPGRFNVNRDHGDILEVQDLLNSITNIIENKPVVTNLFIRNTKPIDPVVKKRLSVHSPVSIDLYDSLNNHTGLVQNPNSDFALLEEQIPNSAYYEFGEGKYVSVPDEGTYRTVIKGTDVGTFTLESENGTNGSYSGGPVYQDIPVSTATVATLTLAQSGPSALSLDVDGDGTVETTIAPDEKLSAMSLLDILEYNVSQIGLPAKQIKKFEKRITKVRKAVTREKDTSAAKRLDAVVKLIQDNLKRGKITAEQSESLLGLVNQIREATK